MRIFTAAALAVLLAFPAWAQPICANYLGMTAQLHTQYGEEVIEERSVEVDGGVIVWQLWANPSTMSWTLTAYVEGEARMCAFNAGDDYHDVSLGVFLDGEAT